MKKKGGKSLSMRAKKAKKGASFDRSKKVQDKYWSREIIQFDSYYVVQKVRQASSGCLFLGQ